MNNCVLFIKDCILLLIYRKVTPGDKKLLRGKCIATQHDNTHTRVLMIFLSSQKIHQKQKITMHKIELSQQYQNKKKTQVFGKIFTEYTKCCVRVLLGYIGSFFVSRITHFYIYFFVLFLVFFENFLEAVVPFGDAVPEKPDPRDSNASEM